VSKIDNNKAKLKNESLICSSFAREARQFDTTGFYKTLNEKKPSKFDHTVVYSPYEALDRKVPVSYKRGKLIPHAFPEQISF
jgi:hypothetical protein